VHIALFHGSREDRCPPAQRITAPFSEDEVAASPFAYHAVGHYHARSTLDQTPGGGTVSTGVRLAYAGSPVALDYTESGEHGALEVTLRFGEGTPVAAIETIRLDPRRVLSAQADVTGCASSEQVDRRLLAALQAVGASTQDLVKLVLSGRLPNGVQWNSPGPEVFAATFHTRWDRSQVRPDHDLEALRHSEGRTTEERFALEMLRRMDAETDPEGRLVLERALYYGLDAFRLREVHPQWEEVADA
jgi:DNA repair exonuclease SbcCD nuclease subunit